MGDIHVFAFAGSLRVGSYNRALLRAALELAPFEVKAEVYDLDPIPLYNGDLEEHNYPQVVIDFKDKIRKADAILIATPEYNYSIPGVLKNAIDWASRPPRDIPFSEKPAAIIGASTGRFGTVRSQMHLRQVLFAVGLHVMNSPEIMVSQAAEKFDVEGKLIDERTNESLHKFWPAFLLWVERIQKGQGFSLSTAR